MTTENLQSSLDNALRRAPCRTVQDGAHILPSCEDESSPKIIGNLKQYGAENRKKWPQEKVRAHIGVAGFFNF